MFKRLVSLLTLLMLCFALSACGSSSSYAPRELAAFNQVYKCDRPASDGSNSVINIANAKLTSDGAVVIDVGAPLAQEIAYAYRSFIYFDVKDATGKSLKIDKIGISEGDHQTAEAIFTLTGSELASAKYVTVGPYKTNNGELITFELQK